MFRAVHSDRSGRLVVASDYAAAFFDGVTTRTLTDAVRLPSDAEVVPLSGNAAVGVDRAGRTQALGGARWAVGAVAPAGLLRTGLPACAADGATPVAPRPYAAVGAGDDGELVVAAIPVDADAPAPPAVGDLSDRITAALRERPSNRLLRQLARCAREYRCRAAANAFASRDDCALPVGAAANEQSLEGVSLRDLADAAPTDVAAFKPSSDEIAEVAISHLERGGTMGTFGRACEGEPLLAVRAIEGAAVAIRGGTSRGTLHLETNGSDPTAMRRLADAGLDSMAIRLVSARADTYEAIHRPSGYRFADVRAGIAAGSAAALSLHVLVLPGLFDREAELEAFAALAGELPRASAVVLSDLAVDPSRASRIAPRGGPPMGVAQAVAALRERFPGLRFASRSRPLARL